jgi:hypothetical protein
VQLAAWLTLDKWQTCCSHWHGCGHLIYVTEGFETEPLAPVLIPNRSNCHTFSLHTVLAVTLLQHRLAALLQTIKQDIQLWLQSKWVTLEHPRCLLCVLHAAHTAGCGQEEVLQAPASQLVGTV